MNKRATRVRSLVLLAAVVVAVAAYPVRADLDEAMNHFKSGKYLEAAAEFQTLVDQAPNYDYGFFMLGHCYLKMKKLDEAETNYKQALEINGDKFEYHHGLANLYMTRRKYQDVVHVLGGAEGLLKDAPAASKYAFHSLRGFAYAALEKWGEAAQDLEKSAAIKKTSSVLDQLGKAYFALGHNDKAARVFEESIKLDPNDAETHRLLAGALLNLGAESRDSSRKKSIYEHAMREAQKYRSMKPKDHEALNLVGRTALGARDFKAAAEAFEQVLALKPDYCYAMVNIAKVHIAEQRWKDAERYLLDASRCAPRLVVVPETLAFVYLKQSRLEEALQACRKADQIQSSASTRECLQVAEAKIEVARYNLDVEKQEAEAQRLAEEEEERIREQQKKIDEYERKTRDN